MSIRTRVEKLEEAMPEKDSDLRLACKSIVRRDENGLLWERPFLVILARPSHPPASLQRHESEDQAAFIERVRGALRQIDPAEGEAFQWTFDPRTDHTE